MRRWLDKSWIAIWVVLLAILCSSSSLAGTMADHLFKSSYDSLFGVPQTGDRLVYQIVYFVAEKSLHFFLFLVFAALLARQLPLKTVVIIGICVGAISESLQALVPDRDPTIRDFFINLAGVAAALVLRSWFRARAGFPVPVKSEPN